MTLINRLPLLALGAVGCLGLTLNACSDVDSSKEAVPPFMFTENNPPGPDSTDDMQIDESTELGEIGAACGNEFDCAQDICLETREWPGGYCSQSSCNANSDCAGDASCLIDGITGRSQNTCVDTCTNDNECRGGYSCRDTRQGYSACLSQDIPQGRSPDGEACDEASDCTGGSCIGEDQGFVDGYCTTAGCDTREDCARGPGDELDNRCLRGQGQNFCVRLCSSSEECRDGYSCQDLGNGQGACFPGEDLVINDDIDAYPFDIACGLQPNGNGNITLNYDIDPSTTSYMVIPFARDLGQLRPVSIDQGANELVDFEGTHQFQAVTSQINGFTNPTVVPGAPQYSGQLQSGSHSFDLLTNSTDMCVYLFEESTPGTTIDVNIYLVGVPGVTAATAAENPNLQAALDAFDTIYAKAGVNIGTVRYLELTPEQTEDYKIIRSDAVLSQLVSLSARPGETTDDALSLNVFFVEAFAMEGGAIGVSLGLPGPAGLHGTPSSGVIFTSEFLGGEVRDGFTGDFVDGNVYTGVVMAHEIGHYLGLFHTTETRGGSLEPLLDTPECQNFNDTLNCPDINNLMFPLAGVTHQELSEEQASAIQANPLTKD